MKLFWEIVGDVIACASLFVILFIGLGATLL